MTSSFHVKIMLYGWTEEGTEHLWSPSLVIKEKISQPFWTENNMEMQIYHKFSCTFTFLKVGSSRTRFCVSYSIRASHDWRPENCSGNLPKSKKYSFYLAKKLPWRQSYQKWINTKLSQRAEPKPGWGCGHLSGRRVAIAICSIVSGFFATFSLSFSE